MNADTDSNADVRAWLLMLLARLEVSTVENAVRTEHHNDSVTIDIKWSKPKPQ